MWALEARRAGLAPQFVEFLRPSAFRRAATPGLAGNLQQSFSAAPTRKGLIAARKVRRVDEGVQSRLSGLTRPDNVVRT